MFGIDILLACVRVDIDKWQDRPCFGIGINSFRACVHVDIDKWLIVPGLALIVY